MIATHVSATTRFTPAGQPGRNTSIRNPFSLRALRQGCNFLFSDGVTYLELPSGHAWSTFSSKTAGSGRSAPHALARGRGSVRRLGLPLSEEASKASIARIMDVSRPTWLKVDCCVIVSRMASDVFDRVKHVCPNDRLAARCLRAG